VARPGPLASLAPQLASAQHYCRLPVLLPEAAPLAVENHRQEIKV
jgi:hypothetical protein